MAGAFVAGRGTAVSTTNGTTISVTTTGAVAAGDTLILCVESGTPILSSVAGGEVASGGTWRVDDTVANGTSCAHGIASLPCPNGLASGTVITATFAATDARKTASLNEFSGLLTAQTIADKNAHATGTSASPSSGATAALTQAAEVAVMCISRAELAGTVTVAGDWTPSNSFTQRDTLNAGATNTKSMWTAYKILSATTAVTGAATTTLTSRPFSAGVVTYLATTAANVTGAFALTASPSLSFAGVRTRLAAFALTKAASTLTMAGQRTRLGAFALTATASLATNGARTRIGAFALTATPSLSFAGVRTRFGAFALSASGSLSIAGARHVAGAFALTALGALSAAGNRVAIGSFHLAAQSSLAASGVRTRLGSFALVANATLSTDGFRLLLGSFNLTAAGTSAFSGVRSRFGAFALSAQAQLEATGNLLAIGSFALHGAGALTASGVRTALGAFSLTGRGTLWIYRKLRSEPYERAASSEASASILGNEPSSAALENDPEE